MEELTRFCCYPSRRIQFGRLLLLLFAVLVLTPLVIRGEEAAGEFHEFTDKKGQTMLARLVAVTEDRRQMRIVREDGLEFDTEINLLSLDDQQYVKDWMKSGAASSPEATMQASSASADYRLDIAIVRATGDTQDYRGNAQQRFDAKENLYRITIRNLSRDTLVGAKLEYVIVWKNAITLFQPNPDRWAYQDHVSAERVENLKHRGESAIEELRFNGECTIDTEPVMIERVFANGNRLHREDELLGMKLQITLADGTLISESHVGSTTVTSMDWADLLALPEPRRGRQRNQEE